MSLGPEAGRLEPARQPAPRGGRAAVEIPVDLHDAEGPAAGVARNVSVAGAFVATSRPAPVGTRLMLMIAFPGDRRPQAVRAEVRWTRPAAAVPNDGRPAGMGVRFVDPPIGVSLSIGELIEAQRTRQL